MHQDTLTRYILQLKRFIQLWTGRNLRDTYVKKRRDIKTSKSGQAADKAKKWHLLDIMNFIEKYDIESR